MNRGIKIGIVFIFIIAIIFVVIFNVIRISDTEREAKEARQEYIRAVTDVYGPNESDWPECVHKTLEYSNTHPILRILQYGSTEMPDFC